MSLLAYLPIEAANVVIIGLYHCTARESFTMQDQKSLTFH